MIDNYNVKAMDSVNKEDWDKFVYDHPHGNIFQTSEMAANAHKVFGKVRIIEVIGNP